MSELFIFGNGGGSGPLALQGLCQSFSPALAAGWGGLWSFLQVQLSPEGS